MIADAVRMIRHCQSDQPGESLHLWVISVPTGITCPNPVNLAAYTATYSRMRLLHPHLLSFQATISSLFSPFFRFRRWYVTYAFLCAIPPSGNEVIGVDSAEVRASVQYLHIIDNQQTLFELSHKLEPRA